MIFSLPDWVEKVNLMSPGSDFEYLSLSWMTLFTPTTSNLLINLRDMKYNDLLLQIVNCNLYVISRIR